MNPNELELDEIEESEWKRAAYEEFSRDDSPDDAVYNCYLTPE